MSAASFSSKFSPVFLSILSPQGKTPNIFNAMYNTNTENMIFSFFWGTLWAYFAPIEARGTEKQAISKKLMMLTYPIEYGNVDTPHPETT